MARYGLKMKARDYMCLNCGNVQKIQTNHTARCMDRCKNCSWKPSYTAPGFVYSNMGGMRMFAYYNAPKAELVRQYLIEKAAQPVITAKKRGRK